MLILPHLEELKEDTNKRLAKTRLVNQDDLANAERQMGRGIMHTEIVRRIVKLTRNDVWVEDSLANPKAVGLYRMFNGSKQYLTSFDKGIVPEYDIIHENERKQIVSGIRGWRTVLSMLKSRRVLTNRQIVSAFGYPRSL